MNTRKTDNRPTPQNSKILLRTTFNGIIEMDRDEALEYAKHKVRAITTGKSNGERLEMVNDRFQGIKFTLNDLGLRE